MPLSYPRPNEPTSSRPARGLPPEEALERYSDPADYAAAQLFADAKSFATSGPPGQPPPEYAVRAREWRKRREKIERALDQQLSEGALLASAVAEYADKREVLEISLWDVVGIDYEFEEIAGDGRTFKKPEIFKPSLIPKNIRDIPDWVWALPNAFVGEANYRRIMYRGEWISLGEKAAKVIQALHLASQTDNPWCEGKALLKAASSNSSKLKELMGDKMFLIESDGGGLYRLNIYRS